MPSRCYALGTAEFKSNLDAIEQQMYIQGWLDAHFQSIRPGYVLTVTPQFPGRDVPAEESNTEQAEHVVALLTYEIHCETADNTARDALMAAHENEVRVYLGGKCVTDTGESGVE